MDFPAPTRTERTGTLIVGGGVAGLAAGWSLLNEGQRDFRILEMEPEPGGNSRSGANAVSTFPWGAHYLTQPNPGNEELIGFLREIEVITGFDGRGRPIYDEACLCAEPAERLLYFGRWQNGLVPRVPLGGEDKRQMNRFFERMQEFKHLKGRDGRYVFDSPLRMSSDDSEFWKLDAIDFATWLRNEGYRAEPLLWYLNYCCRDEYGGTLERVSAWAGLHYFASRRAQAANADASTVLVWPEGNGWLVGRMASRLASQLVKRQAVFRVEESAGGVEVLSFDAALGTSVRWSADLLILALPEHVARRIYPPLEKQVEKSEGGAPWLVANVSLSRPPWGEGEELAWDNVRYGGESLGYVVATHQLPSVPGGPLVITLYKALTDLSPSESRQWAYEMSVQDWADRVESELEAMHPDIASDIQAMDIWLWGHGMACPTPGRLTELRAAGKLTGGRVVLAHTDWSGISTFEEAFDQGTSAAKAVRES